MDGKRHVPPPSLPLPKWLHGLIWLYWPVPMMEFCARHYGDMFTIHLLGRPVVFVTDPDMIRAIFSAAHQYVASDAAPILKPLFGEHSLLFLEGEPHLRARRLLMAAFHGKSLNGYFGAISETAVRAVEKWPRDRSFALQPAIQSMVREMGLKFIVGQGPGTDPMRLGQLHELLDELTDDTPHHLLFVRPDGRVWIPRMLRSRFRKTVRFGRVKRQSDALLFQIIAQRQEAAARGDDVGSDMLARFLSARDEEGTGFSSQELRDHAASMLYTSYETTAPTLCWLFYNLISHPETLQRVLDEIDVVVGKGLFTADATRNLVYLDAAIKETLRLAPVFPTLGRTLLRPFTAGTVHFPAGIHLAPCPYLTHRRADLWPQPHRFRPQRFLGTSIDGAAWFPFGGGSRHCIGMALSMFLIKVVAVEILRRVHMQPQGGSRVRFIRRVMAFGPSGVVPVRIQDRV